MTTPYRYILLADDDADDRFLFREALSSHKEIMVEDFHNGSEVLKKITNAEELPDLLFLDLNMPEMGGKECLQKIRANEFTKALPVVIYSTSSNKKDIEETFRLGANLYVTKPNSFTELKHILNKIVNAEPMTLPDGLNSFVFKM